ncbi:hypothetical protein T484DRAFT_1764579 [Baffinella frigidus]|nr:hypothetical protein T484DRAFT_1764579 [Cryptophyta sp. CCMP2293]
MARRPSRRAQILIPISLLLSENGVALFRGKGDVCHEISGDGMKIMTKEQAGKAAVTFGGLDSRAGKWARTRMGEYEKTEKLKFKAEE